MNASTSEYSSGCESGWTMYLDQISNSDPYFHGNYQEKGATAAAIDDDEDLSMVSDASSGPPNSTYYQDKKKTNTKTKPRKEPKQQSLCLDDTASSSIFHFSHSQDNAPRSDDHNSVYSAAHFEGESVTKKRLSFFKSSTKGKSGSLVGRKRQ